MTREREDFFDGRRPPMGRGGGPPGGMGGPGGPGGGGGRGGFNRQAAVKALKESVQTGHKTGLPPKLLELFAPGAPLPVGTPIQKIKPSKTFTGVAQYVSAFAAPGDEEYEPKPTTERPPSPRLFRNRELAVQARMDTETKFEKKNRIAQWKREEAQAQCEEAARAWDPNKDPKVEGDPYKTIFIARLSYDVTEKKLRREFEEFGPIKRARVVFDKNGKHRGYAFIEFEHKKDMKEAYKQGDGKKIEGRRVIVDVERGRTVDNWRPRRLGGGLGAPGREPKPPKKSLALLGLLPRPEEPRSGAPDRRDFGRPERPRDEGWSARDRSPPRRPRSPPPADRRGDDRRAPDRDRGFDRDRKREREVSPRRDRDDTKRRHVEDGELRDRGRDGGRDGRRRERERDML